jgi:RHS repeat-associated protein
MSRIPAGDRVRRSGPGVGAYGYDPNGRLASVTDVRGKVTAYTYDPSGRLATIVDPNNHTAVTNEYGTDGRVIAQTDARGKRGTFAWNVATQTSTFTDASGGTWVDVYASNVLQRSIDPLGDTIRYAYDANFNVTSITDPRNFVTTLTYDPAGNLLTRTAPAPLSYVETWTYTTRNDVETYRDGRNNTTTYGYDSAGNLTSITAPLSAIRAFGRDPAGTGLPISTTDPRGKTTTYGYDAQANLTSTSTPLGNVTTMTYDAAGRMLTTVEPRGNVVGADPVQYTTSFTYDAAGHLLTATNPLGNVTTRTFDDVGNLLTLTDANQHTTTYAYDAANHLTSVAHPAAGTTTYTYDDVANLATRTDANQHTTTYAYDLAKRLTSVTDPLTNAWILTYDAAGNLATRRDANLKTTTHAYDALNRLTSVTYADASTPTATFGYDANSNRTSMTDGAGTESYTFDALNRVTAVTRGSDTFGYGYDPADNVTSRTYPGQAAQTWAYDDDGRLTSANGATYTYDPAANLLTAATPDGLTARFTYDRAGRLLEVAHTTASATLSRFSYALDPVGNRTAMTTREGTVTYRYDTLDRLTEACWSQSSCPGGAPASPVPCLACIGGLLSRPSASINPPPGETYRTYTYDPVGNRLTEASNAGTTTYAYDLADRLTTVTPPGQSAISYGFDANGNQTTAGATTYTYDLADRLRTATVGATTETYAYAGDGTRLSASTGPQANKTTKYLWDRAFGLPQLALERNGSDSLLRSYAYGLDLLKQQAGTKTYWYHPDGLGSVVDVTGNTGASLSWSEYYPYGLVRQQGNAPGGNGAPAVQPFNFTGEQLDPVTGLYHLRARQYDPGIGRFLTTDPVAAPLSDPYVASYLYGRNNPARFTDPSGEFIPLVVIGWIAFGAVAGAGTYVGTTAVVNTAVYHQDWTTGLNFNDFVLSAGAGAVTGGAGTEWVGLTTLGKAVVGGATGTGAALSSQVANQRSLNPCEVGISAAFGALGSAVNYGSGVQGAVRGLGGGGVLGAIQELITDVVPGLGGVCGSDSK